jgi:hypothetical protein
MKDWESEDDIKAQLRELTERTRKLRRDLHSLVQPSKTKRAHSFAHDHTVGRKTAEPGKPPPESIEGRARRKPE